jgi:4-alpha-glucanotransferase
MALREEHGGASWTEWPAELRIRDAAALEAARRRLARRIEHHGRLQHIAFRQWSTLRDHARTRGVRIIGDVPFYLRHESADVWAHQDVFKLDAEGRPTHVGGVPPDYYSETGQLWNSPVYRWDVLADRGYGWWCDRLRHAFRLFDRVRVDHFRGFAAHWEVTAGEETAENGVWSPGPGAALFEALGSEQAARNVIAEDLGVITPDVNELIDGLGLPGIRVLMFAFGEDYPDSTHLPTNHVAHSVVYTGTHDNNTTRGWFEHDATAEEREHLERHVGRPVSLDEVSATLIRLAMRSIAATVILPMQDVLDLGHTARMNVPSTPSGNWTWRLSPGQADARTAARLRELAREHGRL